MSVRWTEGLLDKPVLGFPGSRITDVEPTVDYLVNGPVGDGWIEGGRYVTTDFHVTFVHEGRTLVLPKSYAWVERARTQRVVG